MNQPGEQSIEDVFGELFSGAWADAKLVSELSQACLLKLPEPLYEACPGISVGDPRNVQDPRQRAGVFGLEVFCHGGTDCVKFFAWKWKRMENGAVVGGTGGLKIMEAGSWDGVGWGGADWLVIRDLRRAGTINWP